MSTISPNMGLVISTIGQDSGLNWETNLNASQNTIDQHNHTSGNGVQIPPAGININTALSFNNQQATNMQAVLFTNQSALATVNALYVKSGELYYNDPTGAVQITAAGAVNATTSGISSGTASAAFSSGVLVVNSNTNTPANIQCGSILLGNVTAASNFITFGPPAALAASYNCTLPAAVPAATSIMQMDTSGNVSAALTVDNSTLQISSNRIQVKAAGIGTTQLADASVTNTKLAQLNYVVSPSCGGSFSTSSTSYVDITNLSVTISTSGRPIFMMLVDDQSGNVSIVNAQTVAGILTFSINGSNFPNLIIPFSGSSTNTPVSAYSWVTNGPGVGTYTIKARVAALLGGGSISVAYCKLAVWEM